ncbi:MAG: hypothetical protein ICV65_15540 [Flavisolibacter sp.]|nr:hypothetical protein [Flavisolibacter sp.]
MFERLKVKTNPPRPPYAGTAKEKSTLKNVSCLKAAVRQTYLPALGEMHPGTRTEWGRRWAPKGHRPTCKGKLGYAFTYLDATIAPATGKLIVLRLPDMTQECFRLFVVHFKQQTRALHGTHTK